jgi:hypothetical protein
MTHSGGKPHTNVGDRGQRYEVTVFDSNKNARVVFGWSNDEKGARAMGEAAVLSPVWSAAQVRDRRASSKTNGAT